MKTVVALFDDIRDAEAAIRDLLSSGFKRDDVSLIASNYWTDDGGTGVARSTTLADADYDTTTNGEQVAGDVAAGAVTGGVVGGLAGVLLGLGVLAIPGFGPVLAAGPIVAGLAGAGIGAAVGGLVGALVSWGVPENEAGVYAEAVRRGGVLVGVKVPEDLIENAADIMQRYNPVDLQARSEFWRSSGWTGYDPQAAAWTRDQIAAERQQYGGTIDYSRYAPEYRQHYDMYYANSGRPYDWYEPAYRYGLRLGQEGPTRDYDTWDEVEADARRGWERTEYATEGAWEQVKDAVRRGWESLKDALDMDDYGRFEPDYRRHYDTAYGTTGRNYDWYAPGYRYGYSMAYDDRYADYDRWEDLEPEARRGWESGQYGGQGAWEDFKDSIRTGWQSVRDAFDEEDYADFEPGYRQHYENAYRTSGRDYNWYAPAYRYGYSLGYDNQYADYDTWEELEPQARRNWEQGQLSAGGGTWEDFKDAIRRGWEDVRDAFDAESDYYTFEPTFREHYDTAYGRTGRDYDWYDPAYRYGYNLAVDDRYADYGSWEDLEPEARRGWANVDYGDGGQSTWEDIKDAVREAWEDVTDAFAIEDDYRSREPGFRDHYERTYRNEFRTYDWYEPAYRYGYVLGMDERFADYNDWDAMASAARREWETSDYSDEGPWEEVKDAVRQGWESVREALDMDDDEVTYRR